SSTNSIGRANLNGTSPNQSFITGANGPREVEVDSSHIYWANAPTGTIGRADLDGTHVDESFITGGEGPPRTPPRPPAEGPRSLGKAQLNKKRGTAKLPVDVVGSGKLELKGKGVKSASKSVPKRASTSAKLAVKPKGKTKSKLGKKGKAKIKVTVTLTPTSGP